MELNRVTPRIYVAATRQDDGKTTTCLGLYAALSAKFKKIGYIKPVGQRFVEVAGKKVDEDSVLVSNTYGVNLPIEAMSPIAVGSDVHTGVSGAGKSSGDEGNDRGGFQPGGVGT